MYAPRLAILALTNAPYFYVPFGILGIALSAGAAKHDGLLGFTSGLLLAQFLYLIFLGGMIAIIKSNASYFLLAHNTISSCLICIAIWGIVCEYPKCLSNYMYRLKGQFMRGGSAFGRATAHEKAAAALQAAAATAGRRPSETVAPDTSYDPEIVVQIAGGPEEDTSSKTISLGGIKFCEEEERWCAVKEHAAGDTKLSYVKGSFRRKRRGCNRSFHAIE